MDESRADAIARAILQPSAEVQAHVQRQREAEAQSLAERRRVAWCVLAGMPVGACMAWAMGHRVSEGALWGGITASALAWCWILARRHRPRR